MNNSNLNNNPKDDAIKSVFSDRNKIKERIEYQPHQMSETEEFFGPQKQNRPPVQNKREDTSPSPQNQEHLNSSDHDKIQVQQYDIPTKMSPDEYHDNQSNSTNADHSFKPIKLTQNSHSTGIAATIAIFVLAFGFGGGYFGYGASKNFINSQKVSADETAGDSIMVAIPTSTITSQVSPTPSPTTSSDPVSSWSIYKNTKYNYSVKYPDTWFGQGVNNEQSTSVQLTSFKPTTTGSEMQTGYKIEILFQDAQGKLLKDWIDDNSAITGNTSKLTELKIDNKDAYQQTVESVGQSINTYVFQADKVMVISYYAGTTDFEKGKTTYQEIVKSIDLL